MRCTIAIAALVAVSLAAPLEKPSDSVLISELEATTAGAAEKPELPEENKDQPTADQLISEAREPQRIEDHLQEKPLLHQNEDQPQDYDTNLNKPELPVPPISEPHPVDHPVLQVQDPHAIEDRPQKRPLEEDNPQVLDIKPELPLPPVAEPHHVQEHGINEHPDRPLLAHPILAGHTKPEELAGSEEELDSGEIAFLQALGALAVNYELQLLQELEKELELDQSGHHHSHGHHGHSHGHGHQHGDNSPNRDADLSLPYHCKGSAVLVPEHRRPLNH